MLELGRTPRVPGEDGPGAGTWRPPIVSTVASTGSGVDDVVGAMAGHHEWSQMSGELLRRRTRRVTGEIEAIVLAGLRERLGTLERGERLTGLAADVVEGRIDPYAAADQLTAGLIEV
jgi:LAO/AO transport system kinase